MSDFSDKYKDAVSGVKISPDFKERTAEKMKLLRDSQETAQPSEGISVNLSDNTSANGRRTFMLKTFSAIAAAAACIAVCISLGKAGVFDKDTELAVKETDAAVTEVTDTDIETNAVTEAVPAEEPEYEAAAESESKTEPEPKPAETQPETKTETTEENVSPIRPENAEPVEASPEPEEAAGAIAPPMSPLQDDELDEAAEESSPDMPASFSSGSSERLDPSLPLEPVQDEYADEYEYDEALPTPDDGEISDDDDASGDGEPIEEAPSVAGTGVAFSPKEAIGAFKAQNTTITITPVSEDISSDFGSVKTYGEKVLRNVTAVLNFEKKLASCGNSEKASELTIAPEDGRYIIDLADKQGSTMRIWFGSRYICYSSEGRFYSFELTEEEYSALDKEIFSLIKK